VSTTEDFISLSTQPIDVAAAIALAGDSSAGAIDIFLGVTRSELNSNRKRLLALDYEAYTEMALHQMNSLANEARQRWMIGKIILIHRTGRVEVGQPSVLIAVSTPHRAESFDACRFLIDSIKSQATIWKREIWEDGNSTWVHPEKA